MKPESSSAHATVSPDARTVLAPPQPASQQARSRRNQRLALLALGIMTLVWGYNWVVMKKVLAYVGPFDFSALRTLFGAVVLLLALKLLRRPMRIRAWGRVVLLGMLQTAAFALLIQLALLHGGAGKTSILVYTMPFWVIPLAWAMFGERVRGLQWLALALAAAGLLLILEPWNHHADVLSEVLALASGLCWALATLVAKWIRCDYPMDVLPLTAWQMLFGALALCVAAWVVPERSIDPTPYFYWALIYNAVLATALAWLLWLFALQHVSAGIAGLSLLGVPVVGVLAGWLELGEIPGALELSGMVLIGVALAVISLRALVGRR
uniref:DMT family transporter n=1 Tax=Castellaniella defragrans TaxID=75697 RepID=UPI003342294F